MVVDSGFKAEREGSENQDGVAGGFGIDNAAMDLTGYELKHARWDILGRDAPGGRWRERDRVGRERSRDEW